MNLEYINNKFDLYLKKILIIFINKKYEVKNEKNNYSLLYLSKYNNYG